MRSGKGGGDSEAALCLIWAALYLLASALIMGKSEEAVSLEVSLCGLFWYRMKTHMAKRMAKTRHKISVPKPIITTALFSTRTVGTFLRFGPK